MKKGIAYDDKHEIQSALPAWYKSIRTKKLSQLSEGDLARFIRQGMYLEYILFESINRLYKNPCSGEKYNGELIEVISKDIDTFFWKENEDCRKHLSNFLSHFSSNISMEDYEELDDFEKEEIMESVNNLSRTIN
nr:contact-dependent growth inhibition system immunity protein [Alkaliphilus hydrothermalis]